MKRKLFLATLISVVLVCLFAVGVSAEVTIYDDAPTKTNITVTTDDIVVFSDGFSCPTGYISSDKTEAPNGHAGALTIQDLFDFSYIRGKTGKNYGFGDIVSLDLPEGVTYLGGAAIAGATNLVRISLPATITDCGYKMFRGCVNLEECVFEHAPNSTVGPTDLDPEFFYGCTKLKAISLPDSIQRFGWTENDANSYDSYFYGCESLTAIYLPRNLQTIYGKDDGKSVFYGLQNAYFVNEPFTYDNIPEKPEIYYFPDGLATMTGTPFKDCKNLNEILVFGTGTTSITRGWEFENTEAGNGKKPTVVFLGEITSINTNGWNVSAVYVANATSGASGSATIYYCKASGNTNHLFAIRHDKAPTCTEDGINGASCFCGEQNATIIPAQHDYGKTSEAIGWIWVDNNYFENASYKHVCQICSEEYAGEEIENSYLFIEEGFATFANKEGEIIKSYDFQYSIKVNTDAMDDYTAATGKVIKYGTVAGVGNSLTNPISYENGTLSVGASAAVSDMTGTDYVKLLIKVTSIPVLEEGVEITCNAYAIVDDKLRYVGETTVTENAQSSLIK